MDEKNRMENEIRKHGFEIKYVEYCENSRTPGFLGQIKGVTDWELKEVRIGLKANPSRSELLATLAHELRHVKDPEWDCGNRDSLGRGPKNK